MPLNEHTTICSKHFVRAIGHLLRAGSVASLHLPESVSTSGTAPKECPFVSAFHSSPSTEGDDETSHSRDTDMQTELDVGNLI